MKNNPGKLILIAGLPGSGKSHWMKENTPPEDFFVVDDFMAKSYGDIGQFTYSRWYIPLVFALRSGRNAAISDIVFCEIEKREEAERVMKDAIHKLDYEWVFFENAPDACRQNIERDEREKGRDSAGRLRELEQKKHLYNVPAGKKTIPVHLDCKL